MAADPLYLRRSFGYCSSGPTREGAVGSEMSIYLIAAVNHTRRDPETAWSYVDLWSQVASLRRCFESTRLHRLGISHISQA